MLQVLSAYASMMSIMTLCNISICGMAGKVLHIAEMMGAQLLSCLIIGECQFANTQTPRQECVKREDKRCKSKVSRGPKNAHESDDQEIAGVTSELVHIPTVQIRRWKSVKTQTITFALLVCRSMWRGKMSLM